jgi:hypothetical protein
MTKAMEKRLLKVCELYDRNDIMLEIHAATCRCDAERRTPCSDINHRRAILRERILNNEIVVLQRKLKISVKDPCPGVKMTCARSLCEAAPRYVICLQARELWRMGMIKARKVNCKHGRSRFWCVECRYQRHLNKDLCSNKEEPRDLTDDLNMSVGQKMEDYYSDNDFFHSYQEDN